MLFRSDSRADLGDLNGLSPLNVSVDVQGSHYSVIINGTEYFHGNLGGTMLLGLYPAELKDGSVVRDAYGEPKVEERHRHRYEVNNAYRDRLERAGLVFSGTSPDNSLVEFVELRREDHPYYVSTQAHPELRSRPTRPHPLFAGLVGAAIERQRELRFPIDEASLRRGVADES